MTRDREHCMKMERNILEWIGRTRDREHCMESERNILEWIGITRDRENYMKVRGTFYNG